MKTKTIALTASALFTVGLAAIAVSAGLALAPAPAVQGGHPDISGAPSATDLPACETEASDNCYWNKYIRGGDTTFIRVDGITYTSDGPVEVDEN